MEEGLREVIGADAARFLDATRLATALLGDSLATNIFLLGYAWQMGLVPAVRARRSYRAIELNGTAVDANRRAFAWGRLACHDPGERRARRRARRRTELGSDRVIATDLDAAIARRVDYLTAYQDAAPRAALPRAGRSRPRRRGARRPRQHAAHRTRSRATTSSCSRSRTSTRSRACTPTASSSARSPRPSRATTGCATTSRRRCG